MNDAVMQLHRNPQHKGFLYEGCVGPHLALACGQAANPLCGDSVRFHVLLEAVQAQAGASAAPFPLRERSAAGSAARAGEVSSARSNSVTPAAVAASGSGASSQAVAASAFPPDASPLAVSRCDGLPPAVVAAAAGVPPFAGFDSIAVEAPLLAEFNPIAARASPFA
ncbi:iron-sulfur cluster assembly scaffold protein [Adlercreutzia aquisgranensis]|uniref:iron-sulfur cluster assembly scaffold protein n=1 Tax=Adlercreutzia aquisgranensis TaxID=2941323 RepID=UPI002041F880|nr:iron-sulfur cluster assembly scaffold protein [Adlercreutzia aquisgranensis]